MGRTNTAAFKFVGALLLATMANPSIAEDNYGQICSFRCAPDAGTQKGEQCLTACLAEYEPAPAKSRGADLSSIHGYWLEKGTPCGTPSDASWYIDATGASAFESSCTVRSATRKGKVFTLKQTCEYFENEVEDHTVRIRVVSPKEIDISGLRYRKCPRP